MVDRSHINLSIIEAVETLSSIADLELDRNIGIAQRHEVILDNQKVDYKTVHWLHKKDVNVTVSLVKEIFRVILHYLRQFYKRDYGNISDPKTVEEIKTIMVLVGEAAKKLDSYTTLFQKSQSKSVTEFKEYKQLQEFYFSKISRKIDEGALGPWTLGLTIGDKKSKHRNIKLASPNFTKAHSLESKHIFVDLETVKKDTEYELFFIRKADGSRFFSPRLLRNIKLVCDFSAYFGNHRGEDPLEHLNQWLDRISHISSRNILKVLGSKLEHFYHDIRKIKHNEVIEILSNAFLALMLSSHSQNLIRHHPIKNCNEYFVDFQLFLRQALLTKTYQKWIDYPPKPTNHLALDLLDLIHTTCRALYTNLQGLNDLKSVVHDLIVMAHQEESKDYHQVTESPKQIWSHLMQDYAAIHKLMKRHPNGPLLRVLNVLEQNAFHVFDPLMQHNIPNILFDLYMPDHRVTNIRFSAPIYQEFIHKAMINEEFKSFLYNYAEPSYKRKHLIINLEDRTSWREFARCIALEKWQDEPELGGALCVVTLAIDTDFFHQLTPYHQMNHTHLFIEQFKEHLQGEGFGFYFPSSIQKSQLFSFINEAMSAIHRIFFSEKNVLTREQRLDFIDIFYLFLQLKLIDWFKPDSFNLSCKDGIDIGVAHSAKIFAFLTLLNNPEWNAEDINYLNFMLYAPALLIRERLILPDGFNRLISTLKVIENTRQELGFENFAKTIEEAFSPLLDMPLLKAKLFPPR